MKTQRKDQDGRIKSKFHADRRTKGFGEDEDYNPREGDVDDDDSNTGLDQDYDQRRRSNP